jgi:hypothetical protein
MQVRIPDLSTTTYGARRSSRVQYISVGWLGSSVPTAGGTPPDVLEKLRVAHRECQLLCGDLGLHACEICNGFRSHGEFFVEHSLVRYLFPNMVFHYIESHDYRLPDLVIQTLVEWNDTAWQQHIVSPEVDRDVRLIEGRVINAEMNTLRVQLLHDDSEGFLQLARHVPSLKHFHIELE